MHKLSEADRLLYSTVRVTTFSSGLQSAVGTAFFYTLNEDAGDCPLLVTNKHVLNGADEIEVVFHVLSDDEEKRPSGQVRRQRLKLPHGSVALHPDPDVDLCAICITDTLTDAHWACEPIFRVTLSRENIPTDAAWSDFDTIEELFMVGYPSGIFDQKNNIPIIRRGTTATPLWSDYNGSRQFVVDIACFGGSSGSPIFVYDRVGYFDRARDAWKIGQRQFLVGILYAGPMASAGGAPSMMHLGYAIKASELGALEQVVRNRLSGVST